MFSQNEQLQICDFSTFDSFVFRFLNLRCVRFTISQIHTETVRCGLGLATVFRANLACQKGGPKIPHFVNPIGCLSGHDLALKAMRILEGDDTHYKNMKPLSHLADF